MIFIVLFATLSSLNLNIAAPLAPSGGIEGSRWFEQMSSAINQPPKPRFQDVNQPFQEKPFSVNQPPQPCTPNQAAPNMGQTPFGSQQQQQPQNPFQAKQPSLFELLFRPVFSDPDFAPQPQGFQQETPDKGQQPQGFEAGKPAGIDSGFGFQNAGFQPQQPQSQQPQPQPQAANAGFQQPNADPNFQSQNPGFQGQQTAGFQSQDNPGFQQPSFDPQQNPTFNDPLQSELSLFNNLLRNFFMW